MDSLPYIGNGSPCQPRPPNITPHGAGGTILGFKSPAPCPPATRIVYPHRASAPPLAVLPSHEYEHVCTSTVVYGKSRVVHVAQTERCVQ